MGETAVLCISMVDSLWLTILDALSLILSRCVRFSVVVFKSDRLKKRIGISDLDLF